MSTIGFTRPLGGGLFAGYKRICTAALSLFALVLIASCDADLQPFEEAILASDLQISSIGIQTSGGQTADIVLNAGERLQFVFEAFSDTSEIPLVVETSNRRWSSSNPDVGTISDSGEFTAGADGQTVVSLRIGGIVSEGVFVNVSNAQLVSIASIDGPDMVSECSSSEYTAMGQFDGPDQSQRVLSNLQWELVSQDVLDTNAANGTNILATPSSATVFARSSGTFTLRVIQDGFSLERDVTVLANLAELQINSVPFNVPIGVGQTVDLLANASSVDAPDQFSPVGNIVAWSVVGQPDIDPIAAIERGEDGTFRLRAMNPGGATLQGLCGSAMGSVNFTVVEILFSDLLVLREFDNGADDVNVADQTITLNVGQTATITATARPVGTTDSGRTPVTPIAEVVVVIPIDDDRDIVDIDTGGSEIEIRGENPGTVTLELSVNGDSERFEVTVN